jgi:hypothetical protein
MPTQDDQQMTRQEGEDWSSTSADEANFISEVSTC